jgi:hypothetical protein
MYSSSVDYPVGSVVQYSSTVYLAIQVNGPSSTVVTPGANGSYWVATGVNSTTPANYISLTALDASATIANYASVFAAAISPTVTPTPVTGYTYSPTTGAVTVTAAGTYVYDFDVLVAEAGSLGLTVNGSIAANTTFGRATGTSQIVGHGLITLSAGDMVNLVNNNSSTALTLAPTSPQVAASFTLVALAAGTPGAAGANGNTVLYGTGAPSAAVGNNGDFYIDTSANKIYGPKASGAWPSGTSLVGPTGAPGPAGTVQGITASYTNSATAGVGTASMSGTATNPVVNVNFPNDVQSIGIAPVGNTAPAGGGTLTLTGPATNPVLNINFPASSGGGGTPTIPAWSSGTDYTTGQLVTYNNAIFMAVADNTSSSSNEPGTSGGATYWGGISIGTGANPIGIPYTVAGHLFATSIYYYSPTGNQSSTLTDLGTAIAPTACTPSMTIYSYVPLAETWTLGSVTPTSSSNTWTLGSSLASCPTSPASGSTPQTCSTTALSQVNAGTIMTIYGSAALSSGYAGLQIAFSCQ